MVTVSKKPGFGEASPHAPHGNRKLKFKSTSSLALPVQANRMKDIPFSGIRKIFEECNRLESEGKDIVHFEIGSPDFDTPNPIKESAKEAIDAGHVHYTSNYGIPELRSKLSHKFAVENNLSYDPEEEIIVTAGATEAVFISILSLVDPNDEVLIPDPCWTYEPAINAAEATPVTYRLDPTNEFQPDEESLREAISENTKLLIVNTPHNPTGSILTDRSAEMIRDIAVEHDLYVISDEIYEKIIHAGAHVSIGSKPGMFERTVTINGFSKAYSMTGWRLGYLAAPQSLIDSIIRLRQYTSTCASSISQHAGLRALEGDLHAPLADTYSERRSVLLERIEQIPGMTCPEPKGAFYAMPTLPDEVTDVEEFVWDLLREQGVATVPGSVFGESAQDRIRFAYSIPKHRIEEGFDRIEAYFAE